MRTHHRGLMGFSQMGIKWRSFQFRASDAFASLSAHQLDLTQLDPDLVQLQPTDSLQGMPLEHVCPDSPVTRLASLHANLFLPQRVSRMSWGELPLNGWPPWRFKRWKIQLGDHPGCSSFATSQVHLPASNQVVHCRRASPPHYSEDRKSVV